MTQLETRRNQSPLLYWREGHFERQPEEGDGEPVGHLSKLLVQELYPGDKDGSNSFAIHAELEADICKVVPPANPEQCQSKLKPQIMNLWLIEPSSAFLARFPSFSCHIRQVHKTRI